MESFALYSLDADIRENCNCGRCIAPFNWRKFWHAVPIYFGYDKEKAIEKLNLNPGSILYATPIVRFVSIGDTKEIMRN